MKTQLGILLAFYILVFKEVSSRKDNIIFILADDLGWNDVAFNGMSQIPTPNINSLAAHGVVISNYYSAPMCSPSRAATMTGRYPSRIGFQNYVIPENGPWGLPLHVPTLADKLNELGYVSRLLGKWHLGFYKSKYLPENRGFQSHFGFWTGALDLFNHTSESKAMRKDYKNVPENCTDEIITAFGHNLREGITERKDLSGQYLTDLLTSRAVDIISTHNTSKPLFLLLAHHAPHRGNVRRMSAPEKYLKEFDYIKDEARRIFAGAMRALDLSVGEVILALEAKGMLEDSLVIFASDNGADNVAFSRNGGSNWPLRGQKFTAWEGAVRVPAVVWSKKIQQPGIIWNGLMHVSDWLPTLYSFAGGDPETLANIDGYDLWKLISQNLNSSRNEVLIHSDPIWKMSALRVGDYKLIKGSFPGQDFDGWYGDSGREEETFFVDQCESSVSKVLREASMPSSGVTPIVTLKCGDKPTDPSQECNVKTETCVFNIKEDPCEYRNLARTNKQLLERLISRLKEYEEADVPPLSGKRDYLANPKFHNGSWVPWGDCVNIT